MKSIKLKDVKYSKCKCGRTHPQAEWLGKDTNGECKGFKAVKRGLCKVCERDAK